MLDSKSGARDDMCTRYILSDIATVAHSCDSEKRGMPHCSRAAVQAAVQASVACLRRFDEGARTKGDSGDRSAAAANLLAYAGFKKVYSVVDGVEGDLAKDGPKAGQRVVNS